MTLIHQNGENNSDTRFDRLRQAEAKSHCCVRGSSAFGYVVVVSILLPRPTVAIMQWKNEIEAYTEGLKVAIWHGASREGNIKELVKFDIVRLFSSASFASALLCDRY